LHYRSFVRPGCGVGEIRPVRATGRTTRKCATVLSVNSTGGRRIHRARTLSGSVRPAVRLRNRLPDRVQLENLHAVSPMTQMPSPVQDGVATLKMEANLSLLMQMTTLAVRLTGARLATARPALPVAVLKFGDRACDALVVLVHDGASQRLGTGRGSTPGDIGLDLKQSRRGSLDGPLLAPHCRGGAGSRHRRVYAGRRGRAQTK
jgi:hypothetical protein